MALERRSWFVLTVCVACALAVAAGFAGIGPATAEEAETVDVIAMESLDPREPSIAAAGSMGEIAFVAGSGTAQSIYHSAEQEDGSWSVPVRISGNDTADFSPDLAVSAGGERGVAYVSWDPVNRHEVFFAEYVDGEWVHEMVTTGMNRPGIPGLVYKGDEPHIVFMDVSDSWRGYGPVYHVFRDGSGEWTLEELEGPDTTNEFGMDANHVAIDSHGSSLAYAWTRVDVDESDWFVLESRRIAVLASEASAPTVPLPNPNDTADFTPFLKLDENGKLRLFFNRGVDSATSESFAVYATEATPEWELVEVAENVWPFGFDYEAGVALCGYQNQDGDMVVSQYMDGDIEPTTYAYQDGADSADVALSGGYMLLAQNLWDDGELVIEIRKRKVAEYQQPVEVVSIAGEGRHETAVEASKAGFPEGADTVVIATGRNWPDALGGSALAGVLEAPILLVNTTSVPEVVADEIERLGATDAVIVGGEVAVGPSVQTALQDAGLAVERIAGTSRYETADLVAARVVSELDEEYDGTAFVATGASYADAVAAAPLAAAKGWPLFLAHPTSGITDETRLAFDVVERVLVLGGDLAVSPETQADIAGYVGGDNVVRLAGNSRYQTAVTIATYGVESAGLSWDRVGIATGQAYPDALAGGVLQGRMGSVMLLTRSTSLDEGAKGALAENKDAISSVTFFGGDNAVSPEVRAAVAQVLE